MRRTLTKSLHTFIIRKMRNAHIINTWYIGTWYMKGFTSNRIPSAFALKMDNGIGCVRTYIPGSRPAKRSSCAMSPGGLDLGRLSAPEENSARRLRRLLAA